MHDDFSSVFFYPLMLYTHTHKHGWDINLSDNFSCFPYKNKYLLQYICVSKKEHNIFSQGSYTFSCTVFEWQSNGFLSYDVVCKGVITVQRVFGDNIFGLHFSGQEKLKNLIG